MHVDSSFCVKPGREKYVPSPIFSGILTFLTVWGEVDTCSVTKKAYKEICEEDMQGRKQASEQADQAKVEEAQSEADEGDDRLRAMLAALG